MTKTHLRVSIASGRCRLILLFFTALSTSVHAQIEVFRANYQDQGITVQWNVPNSTDVYISLIGTVPKEGSHFLQRIYQDSISMVASIGENIVTRVIAINGPPVKKGTFDCADFSLFEKQYKYDFSPKTLFTIAIRNMHDVLQNRLGLTVAREYLGNDSYVFETHCSMKTELTTEQERQRLDGRRLAFQVEIKKKGKEAVTYTIKPAIFYKLRLVTEWRRESTEKLFDDTANQLQDLVKTHKHQ